MTNDAIFFVGIKGTGMSALAKICHDLGYEVSGSDIDRHFFTEDSLRDRKIPIHSFSQDNIKDNMTVVLGLAFGDDHPEIVEARRNPTVKAVRYHKFLGMLMERYVSIAVSGSHGKTTTTTLLKDMLSAFKPTGYLIGDGTGELASDDTYFAVEACEYKRHFLAYKPKIAIMTNFEIDHVDYFTSEEDYLAAFEEFGTKATDLLIVCGDDPHARQLDFTKPVWFYGFDASNKIMARNIEKTTASSRFDVWVDGAFIHRFDLPLVGDHMILNALAVIAVGIYEAIDPAVIELGLQQFKGAKRRFVVDDDGENVYIDDYAHHPTEIRVTLEAARTRYPNRKIVAIFKPHRVGRIHYFADEFAQALMLADVVGLCPFTSIDDAQEGIDIDITYLQERIPNSLVVDTNDTDAKCLAGFAPAVFVFMSSKDIYDLKDLVKMHVNN